MKNIIFIAPPAAGKGTQSTLLKEKYCLAHISTGDLLRKASLEENERGHYIKDCLKSGKLVSDEITLDLLTERLKQEDCKNGFILDGFPRNLDQVLAYEKLLEELQIDLGYVIFLSVPKELAEKRILGRETCPDCGAVFNDQIEGSKPKVPGICDVCGTHLTKRKDDNLETFSIRYDTYMEHTKPLIDHFEKLGVLYTVPSIDRDETFKMIEKIIKD